MSASSHDRRVAEEPHGSIKICRKSPGRDTETRTSSAAETGQPFFSSAAANDAADPSAWIGFGRLPDAAADTPSAHA
jgi:hypothetical protein